MANKVQYGLKNVHYATVTVGTNSVTYGTPVAWQGAVSLSLSAEGDTNDFYADNTFVYGVDYNANTCAFGAWCNVSSK